MKKYIIRTIRRSLHNLTAWHLFLNFLHILSLERCITVSICTDLLEAAAFGWPENILLRVVALELCKYISTAQWEHRYMLLPHLGSLHCKFELSDGTVTVYLSALLFTNHLSET